MNWPALSDAANSSSTCRGVPRPRRRPRPDMPPFRPENQSPPPGQISTSRPAPLRFMTGTSRKGLYLSMRRPVPSTARIAGKGFCGRILGGFRGEPLKQPGSRIGPGAVGRPLGNAQKRGRFRERQAEKIVTNLTRPACGSTRSSALSDSWTASTSSSVARTAKRISSISTSTRARWPPCRRRRRCAARSRPEFAAWPPPRRQRNGRDRPIAAGGATSRADQPQICLLWQSSSVASRACPGLSPRDSLAVASFRSSVIHSAARVDPRSPPGRRIRSATRSA